MERIIDDINNAKRESETIYSAGDIRSSGDSVEELIREKISLFLPERFLVKQGHIVNSEGLVSNQFDVIIFDRFSTPKFFESRNETVFYPIESVLAVGEIKKTLRKNDLIDFSKKIKYLKEDMKRELIPNTVYGGSINDNSEFIDIVNMPTNRRFRNPLSSFIFAIDVDDINKIDFNATYKHMPNDIYILNHGYIVYGDVENKMVNTYVEDEKPEVNSIVIIEKSGINCLAGLFNHLLNHLNSCLVQPFTIDNYIMNNPEFQLKGKDVKAYGLDKNK
jgi:hypothetical protein